jgi:FSR family fosmidomycin resistance protein-like MFS transporter
MNNSAILKGTKDLTKDRNRKLSLIYLQHFLNDLHIAFLQTFLPFLIENLGITVTQAGVLTSLPGLYNMFLQPVMGFISDRSSKPVMIILGPVLTAFGASLIPFSPSYGFALVLVSIWGLGSAVFHPQGHGCIGYIGEKDKLPLQLAFFSMVGILGSSLSPLYATFLFKYLKSFPLNMVPLLPVTVAGIIFFIFAPSVKETITDQSRGTDNFLNNMKSVLLDIWPIWTVTFLRDITNHGIKFLFPLLIALRGGGIERIGFALFLIQLIKVISPVAAGKAALKYGNKRVILFAQGLSPLLLFPELFFKGWFPFALFLIGNALLISSSPLLVTRAQKLAPEAKSMATSLLMGVAFGLSGLMMTIVGKIADMEGIIVAFSLVLLFPLLNCSIILFKWGRE